MKTEVTTESFALLDENGNWLGQVVLTSDGMFASVTDYGNFSYAWRAFGDNFKEFLLSLNVDYFGSKMYGGYVYVAYGPKIEKASRRLAEMILPALQTELKKQLKP